MPHMGSKNQLPEHSRRLRRGAALVAGAAPTKRGLRRAAGGWATQTDWPYFASTETQTPVGGLDEGGGLLDGLLGFEPGFALPETSTFGTQT